MFKPLRRELLRGLKELGQAAPKNQTAPVPAYVAEVLEHRGLAKRDPSGQLLLTSAGQKLLDEHVRRGLVSVRRGGS